MDTPAKLEPLLISANDAASLLGMSRSLFYQLLSSQRIPLKPVRFGRKRLWRVDELKRWILDNCPANWSDDDGD